MLFQDQRESYGIQEGDVLYYSGAFLVSEATRIIGSLIGIKKKNGMIHYRVMYHTRNAKELKREATVDPIEFEKFIVTFANTIKNKIPDSELIEYNYRVRTLDDPHTVHLDDDDQEVLHRIYLMDMILGKSRNETYTKIIELVKDRVRQRLQMS